MSVYICTICSTEFFYYAELLNTCTADDDFFQRVKTNSITMSSSLNILSLHTSSAPVLITSL